MLKYDSRRVHAKTASGKEVIPTTLPEKTSVRKG
jgi:hypothetical protein